MSQNPYRRIIPLVQHSPLIHFQAEQAGATLRATEVKPKLDKFILTELRSVYPEAMQAGDEEWMTEKYIPDPTSGNQTSSGYQMHISGTAERWYVPVALISGKSRDPARQALTQLYPQAGGNIHFLEKGPYFANADKIKDQQWDQVRMAVMYRNVQIQLTSKEPKLLDFLQRVLPYFLVRHNFGTRSNKGFGCFLPSEGAGEILNKHAYRFTLNIGDNRDHIAMDELFKQLNLFYNTLRSGINALDGNRETTFYFKSLLFLYFKQRGIQWDKKSIKQEYFPNIDKQHKNRRGTDPDTPIGHESGDALLVRDIMGLASDQKWGFDYRNANISKKHRAQDDDKKIARAASPIWFKPVRSDDRKSFEVFVGYRNPSSHYLGETFTIQSNKQGNLSLSLPTDFDMKDFLDFAFSRDLYDHVEQDFHGTSEFQTLKNIYSQLNENLY